MATLEPHLWGNLPEELLHLVFARLPVFAIAQLRTLSKVWKENIDAKDSEFTRAFNAIKPFALIYLEKEREKMDVFCNIYDLQQNDWHVHNIERNLKYRMLPRAFDGGLVCYIFHKRWIDVGPPIIIVMNPLTRKKKKLPPLLNIVLQGSDVRFLMVELVVEKTTNEYKLYVVGRVQTLGGRYFAQFYDSHLQTWSMVESREGRLFGWQHTNACFLEIFPCVYNFANQKLKLIESSEMKFQWTNYTLIHDHLFAWHKDETLVGSIHLTQECMNKTQKYYIIEYHLPEKSTSWMKLRVHDCDPMMYSFPQHRYYMTLQARNGFLLVYMKSYFHNIKDELWLYNLSIRMWHRLPGLRRSSVLNCRRLCELNWSALP